MTTTGNIVSILIVATIIGLSWFTLPILPDPMVTHFNASGLPDGFMPKELFAAFMSGLSVLLLVIFLGVPRLDPLKKNIDLFSKAFDYFKMTFFVFILYVYSLTIFYNLYPFINLVQYMAPGFGILLFSTGILIQHAKPNWFIGIRTPWTLSNEKVWYKTHYWSSLGFKLSGIMATVGFFFPAHAIILLIGPILITVIFSLAYSYYIFPKDSVIEKIKPKIIKKKVSKKKRK